MKKTLLVVLGVVLVLSGIPLLVLPGPGLLLIGAGAWILVAQFRTPRRQGDTQPRQPNERS